MTRPNDHYQVAVIGAGPMGLFTAERLAQAGIRVVLLEHVRCAPLVGGGVREGKRTCSTPGGAGGRGWCWAANPTQTTLSPYGAARSPPAHPAPTATTLPTEPLL